MAGVYGFFETHGLPLENILHHFKTRSLVVDWVDFFTSAMLAGARYSPLRSKVDNAVIEIYGPEYHKEFSSRMNKI